MGLKNMIELAINPCPASLHDFTVYLDRNSQFKRWLAKACGAQSPSLGAKPKYDWGWIEDQVFKLMDYHGDFSHDDPKWNARACLERSIAERYIEKFGREPSASQLKQKIGPMVEKWVYRHRGLGR